ncbi:hypothetical protein [Paraburkholderia aromaticivorans]|uniref:hypothetical protein n=1 Tax=Paraburkholderia aromaticivorans TaxID=2026199 RepID=UPI0019807591|nr:hypothetical protein [Paraburkholderia aromaticivorans]
MRFEEFSARIWNTPDFSHALPKALFLGTWIITYQFAPPFAKEGARMFADAAIGEHMRDGTHAEELRGGVPDTYERCILFFRERAFTPVSQRGATHRAVEVLREVRPPAAASALNGGAPLSPCRGPARPGAAQRPDLPIVLWPVPPRLPIETMLIQLGWRARDSTINASYGSSERRT